METTKTIRNLETIVKEKEDLSFQSDKLVGQTEELSFLISFLGEKPSRDLLEYTKKRNQEHIRISKEHIRICSELIKESKKLKK